MPTQLILAEKTVSATELRKQPCNYFLEDEPVAVLSNNKTAGYMVSAELFEKMVRLIDSRDGTFKSTFRPSKKRLEEIAAQTAEMLSVASDADLSEFSE